LHLDAHAPDLDEASQPHVAEREPAALEVVHGENLEFLRGERDGSFALIAIDPPFNTGRVQRRLRTRTPRDPAGTRIGFRGETHRVEPVSTSAFDDRFGGSAAYLDFLEPRFVEARRVLTPNGTLVVHVDPRESHYVKVLLDGVFGRRCYLNQIVWAYDYGARSRTRWPAKHDVLLVYTKDPKHYTFRYADMDRVPYLAPKLVGPEKAARGKTPTDVWWQTIVPPGSKERTGYPTQKPLAIYERLVRVHSNPGDVLLDFFAGSGTFGEAAARNGRRAVLVDSSSEAVAVMERRLAAWAPQRRGGAAQPG